MLNYAYVIHTRISQFHQFLGIPLHLDNLLLETVSISCRHRYHQILENENMV